MAFTCGKMEIGTKANGKTVSNMDRAQTFLQMETVSLEPTIWVSQRVKASTSGRMRASILESLETD